MTAQAEERCELTEMLVSQCGHCTGRTGTPEPREPGLLGPWFTAAYPGRCGGCDERIEAEDMIRADGEGGYLCEVCGREEDRP